MAEPQRLHLPALHATGLTFITSLLLSLHPLCTTMARTVGRAPAFTEEENQALLDSLLPQYCKLYGRPGEQVTAHEKKGIWKAIVRAVRSVGVHKRHTHNVQKRWQDLRAGPGGSQGSS